MVNFIQGANQQTQNQSSVLGKVACIEAYINWTIANEFKFILLVGLFDLFLWSSLFIAARCIEFVIQDSTIFVVFSIRVVLLTQLRVFDAEKARRSGSNSRITTTGAIYVQKNVIVSREFFPHLL